MEPVTKEQHVYLAYHGLRAKIHQMWSEFLGKDSRNSRNVVKPASFNVNERVFNLVVKNHIDLIEQFDLLEVYWERPFGGNVTVRTVSTKYQFDQFSAILQHATNELFRIHTSYKIEDTLNQFELLRLQVPKNFIRKLVGYQEKFLQYFRMAP